MEQHLQDVAQNIMTKNNSEFFAANFAKKITQKQSSKQCRNIMSLGILSTVNPNTSIKTWVKSSCTVSMK